MTVGNRMLDECAEHLAREHHEQGMRIAGRMSPDAARDVLGWDQLEPGTRTLAVQTMRSLLYRGGLVCPRREHRITISLRQQAPVDPGSAPDDWQERARAIPGEWVAAAEAHYSMHGAGLIRNILAGVAPLIAAAERERIARAIEASILDDPAQRYERWPCTCLEGRECFPHACHRVMNEVTVRCDEDTWPVILAAAVWDAVEPLIRRDAANIARQEGGERHDTRRDEHAGG